MEYEELHRILKSKAQEIDINEFTLLSNYFRDEVKYLPSSYKKQYIKNVQERIMKSLLELKNSNKTYCGLLNSSQQEMVNKLLDDKYNNIELILNIVAVYRTVLLRRPIHEDAFPGNMNVYKKRGNYYCYVKKNHVDDDNSLCRYCVAKPVEDDENGIKKKI